MFPHRSLFILSGLCALTAGCEAIYDLGATQHPIACRSDDACAEDTVCDVESGACVRPPPTKDLDVLFVIDNSPSMTPKQQALATNIPKFIAKLEQLGVNYHIGITTSDVGTNVRPGVPWGGFLGTCDTFSGDDGALQDIACSRRSNGTPEAVRACAALCPDARFVPTDGNPFISKSGTTTNVPPDVRPDPSTGKMIDFGPSNAFKCMALVGDGGCGVEGQLEGARRALDGHRRESAGFLRRNSMLAVIFITDEDDCSVQLARRSENNPSTRDCSAPDRNASYDCFNVDYRCLARSIECDEPMNTPGTKNNCKERAGNYLEPVQKYVSFFSALRPRSRLLISGIWTLPSIDKGGRMEVVRGSGGISSPYLNRAPGTGASCSYSGDTRIVGQAQLRLSSFARSFKDGAGRSTSVEVSICDIDNYPAALDKITAAIGDRAGWAPSS